MCSATDEAGNEASIVFTVVVRDSTKPTLQLPPEIVRQAADSSGVIVTFQAIAEDAVDSSPGVTCEPASGSRFSIGGTQVTCSARDSSGNVATGSFLVTIRAPEAVGPAGVIVEPWVIGFLLVTAGVIVGVRAALRERRTKRRP